MMAMAAPLISFIYIGLLLLCLLNYDCTATSTKPNILLIVVDDLRPALGCYGDEKAYTPNIDYLSKEGILFKKAFVQQALCAPSRNSFLTSRRPDTLHLYDFYSYWRDAVGNFSTLPQVLKASGYETMSIGKVFHPGISSNWSDDQPYSWSTSPYHPSTEIYKEAKVCVDKNGMISRNLVCPVVPEFQPEGTLPDIQSLQKAKNFLDERNRKDQPFFLALGFHKPHVPLKYPSNFLDHHPLSNVTLPGNRYRSFSLPLVAWNPWTDVRSRDDISKLNISFPFGSMPDEWSKLISQSYYAAVSYIDSLVGEIILKLKEQELYDNTIIAFIGDHGWSLGEHGEWSKFSNFETAVHIPFILRIPSMISPIETNKITATGHTSNVLVELVDLFPTLIDLVQLKPVPQCLQNKSLELCTEGVSLLPVIQHLFTGIKNWSHWKTGVFSQYPRPGIYPSEHPNSDKPRLKQIKYMGYSLRTKRFRYTEWVRFKQFSPIWSSVAGVEMYDHVIDPEENLNLADKPELEDIRHALRKQLRAGWRESLPQITVKNLSKAQI